MQRKTICFLIFLMLSALPVHGENAMDYFNLGLKSNLTPTKIKYFSKALELDPNMAEAYRMLGIGYLNSGFYERAIDRFTRAIEMESDLASAYANRAEAYRLIGKY